MTLSAYFRDRFNTAHIVPAVSFTDLYYHSVDVPLHQFMFSIGHNGGIDDACRLMYRNSVFIKQLVASTLGVHYFWRR